MEKKPDFAELALRNACLSCEPSYAAGCEKIWTDYVTPLQSQLSEAEKRIKELEEISAEDDHTILTLEDQLKTSESQNERILSALKEREEIILMANPLLVAIAGWKGIDEEQRNAINVIVDKILKRERQLINEIEKQ